MLSTLAFSSPISEGDWVDDGKHLVVHVRHHEGTHAFDRKVKVVDHVASLVEVVRLSEQLLFQARANPSQEILVAQRLEQVKFLEALFMNFFADLQPQVQGQLLNEVVKGRVVCLAVVLEGLADVEEELVGNVVLHAQLAQVEKFFL